jgi:hypothetical protein
MLGLLEPLGNHGCEAGLYEIDLVDAFSAVLELFSHRKIDGFEVRLE